MKSAKIAIKFFNKANESLAVKNYKEALENFNQVLRFAPAKSILLPEAFTGRAQIFLELKQIGQCQQTLNFGFASLSNILKMLQVECSKIESHAVVDDVWSFFKLSHPANQKIPFIVDCLKVLENSVYGRQIVTTQDLRAGDIVIVEEPFYKVLDKNCRQMRCAICLLENAGNLIPCDKCNRELLHILKL